MSKRTTKSTVVNTSSTQHMVAYYELGAPVGQGPFAVVTLHALVGNEHCTVLRPRRKSPEMVEMQRCRTLDEAGKPTSTQVTWRHPAFSRHM